MAHLEDIREELYKKKPKPPVDFASGPWPPRTKRKEIRQSWQGAETKPSSLLDEAYFSKMGHRRSALRFLVLSAIIVLVGVGGFIAYSILFPSLDAKFSIVGPDHVTAGEPAVFLVTVLNKSRIAMKEGRVVIILPEGSLFAEGGENTFGSPRERFEVADVPAGGKFEKEIRARILGSLGEKKIIEGSYVYRPENIQSPLAQEAQFKTNVVRVPVAVTVETPERVGSGQEVTLRVGVDSELSAPLPDIALGIDFPSGFTLKAADPPPPEGQNIWPLEDLASGTSQKIVLRGVVRGEPEEVKALNIRLGRYSARDRKWLVLTETSSGPSIASPFLLAQTTLGGARAGSLAPGERVDGNVVFRNNLKARVRNLSVTVSFPEKFVELESIRAENGFYDVTRRALVWRPSSEPRLQELSSGEEGTLVFSLVIKETLPIRSFSDKNFLFGVTTTIDSADIPPEFRGVSLEYRDLAEFKIESSLHLTARAAYYNSLFAASGPLPPKVRQTTTYTVHLQLLSGANDLKDVEVKANLSGGVAWKNSVATDVGAVTFNPATQELVWRIPKLTAATGILRSPVTAAVQVALTPAETQINTSPNILVNIAASGIDVFTNAVKSDTVNNLTTELRSDAQSKYEEWRVVR